MPKAPDELSTWQRAGDILSKNSTAPSAALADLLLALVAGLRVNARADFGAARLQRTVDLTLAVLDSG